MRIDSTGEQETARRIDKAVPAPLQIHSNRYNFLVLDAHIRQRTSVRVNDGCPFEHSCQWQVS
jgi:hypothetical protein